MKILQGVVKCSGLLMQDVQDNAKYAVKVNLTSLVSYTC